MDQTLIDKVAELTGKEGEAVQEMLAQLTVDQMFDLIDMDSRGDSQAIVNLLRPFVDSEGQESQPEETGEQPDFNQTDDQDQNQDNVEEAMSKKTKVPGQLPKPRDPMAKALALPQYQSKKTPTKKGKLDKMDRKHKGSRVDDSFDIDSVLEGKQVVEEGVMGFSAMPALKRTLELAGRPTDEESLAKAMEDFMGDFGEIKGLSINDIATPVGTSITPGPVTMDEPQEPQETISGTTAYQTIRQAVEDVKVNLASVTVTEYAQVRQLLSELTSMMDKLGNAVKGQ